MGQPPNNLDDAHRRRSDHLQVLETYVRITRLFISALLVIGLCISTTAQCRAPHFHIGQDFSNPEQGIGSLAVSLQPKDFTFQKLSCLCQMLMKENPKWERGLVQIFTSRDAADNMSHMLQEPPPEAKRWDREDHAFCSLDKSRHEEQLTILPLGLHGPPSLKTITALPVTTITGCQVEIGHRCLVVALGGIINYPEEALKLRAGGKVTVAGVIDRKGGMRQMRLVSADVHPDDGSSLENAALRDLGTWRFDSGDHSDAVQIVYSFEINAPDPLYSANTSASFSPPNEVEIRLSPTSVK
jgi:hypothetical protein